MSAARYNEAALIVVSGDPAPSTVSLPEGALVVATSGSDADGGFASLLGRVAAAIDSGASAGEAFADFARRAGAVTD
jgi:hypothetical protein